VGDQVSHQFKAKGKNIPMEILILNFLDNKLENIIFCTEWQQAFPDFGMLSISS